MELGNNIFNLRKNAKLSQEQLAEKLNVTRQTISNWELGQTVPDIVQAKEIARAFNITLDELVDNDVKDIIMEKINNTEKLANKTMKILKYFMILIICFMVIGIISVNVYLINFKREKNDTHNVIKEERNEYISESTSPLKKQIFYATLNGNEYQYEIEYNEENYKISTSGMGLVSGKNIVMEPTFSVFDYNDARDLIEAWKTYFEVNGGTWKEAEISTIVTENDIIEGKLYISEDSNATVHWEAANYSGANPNAMFLLEIKKNDSEENSMIFGHAKQFLPVGGVIGEGKYSLGILRSGEYTYTLKPYVDVSGKYQVVMNFNVENVIQ